jgi:protein-disulfide isomerase
MRLTRLVVLLRLALLVALASSAVLVLEYQDGGAAFCGAASGCEKVRESAFSQFFSTTLSAPLPNVSVFLHMALLGASLFATSRLHHRLIAAAAGAGALVGLALLVVQAAVVGAACVFCVAVDTSALVAGVAAVLAAREVGRDEELAARVSPDAGTSVVGAWAAAAALATALPFVWAAMPPRTAPPPAIAALGVAGKVTVVSFTDFECPYCRRLHPALDGLVAASGGRVALVRKMAPLTFHLGAMPAAKAFVCAPEASRDAVAHALYEADPGDLRDEGPLAIAAALGLDRAALEACFRDPATAERVERDKDLYKAVSGKGLPLTVVDGTVVLGFRPDELERAFARALGGAPVELAPASLYAVLALVFLAAAGFTLRRDAARSRRG